MSADFSSRRSNTTHRRYGLDPDRTASYPLLGVYKPVPTAAGVIRATSDAAGATSGGGGGVRRNQGRVREVAAADRLQDWVVESISDENMYGPHMVEQTMSRL